MAQTSGTSITESVKKEACLSCNRSIISAVESGRIPNSKIIRLIVNRGKIVATQRADKHNIPWEYFNLIAHKYQSKGEKDPEKIQAAREKYDADLAQKILAGPRPELIVLAGWMHVFSPAFLDPLDKEGVKIINLHPALPGEFSWLCCMAHHFSVRS